MFTGIVAGTGLIQSIEEQNSCHRVTLSTDLDLSDGSIGESIAVNGCCLTVVEFVEAGFKVDVAQESLNVTTLGQLQPGSEVNLERAMRLTDRLGGHWVQGHVDGIGSLLKREPASRQGGPAAEGELWVIRFPAELRRYLVKKGSITVDGVSLTLNEVADDTFEIFLIPHTLEVTNLGARKPGDALNLEVDILGKYIETLLTKSTASS